MFCSKCGKKLSEGAAFCSNCGAKVYENAERKTSIQSLSNANPETAGVVIPLTDGDSSISSVELVVSSEKVKGRAYSKVSSPVYVDNIKIGALLNGETTTYKISSGQHCIKIGAVSIWVDIPQASRVINLNFNWGLKTKPEIVCQQEGFVTRASELDSNVERKMGIWYVFVGFVSCFFPLAGVIVFFRLKKTDPKTAKIAGVSALVGWIIGWIIIAALQA